MTEHEGPILRQVAEEMRGISVRTDEDRRKQGNLALALEYMAHGLVTRRKRFLLEGRFGEGIGQMPIYEAMETIDEVVKRMKPVRKHRATKKGERG